MTSERIIAELGLLPHPEGGHFREVFRSPLRVAHPTRGARSASTAIYFLLRTDEFSAFHRVTSDEVWHYYAGDPLVLHVIQEGSHRKDVLGPGLDHGERPLAVVPANAWQAAKPAAGPRGYSLCGCTVAPGFEFADFELPTRADLLAAFPHFGELIRAFTR